MTGYDDERIGELLRLLPPAPGAWVQAASELPAARAALDGLVARAEEDAAFRERLLADLETALRAEGLETSPRLVSQLRRLLDSA